MSGFKVYCPRGHSIPLPLVCPECSSTQEAVAEVVKNEAGQVGIVFAGGKQVIDFVGAKFYTAPVTAAPGTDLPVIGWLHEIEWVDGWGSPAYSHGPVKPKPYLEVVPHPAITGRIFVSERFTPLIDASPKPVGAPGVDLVSDILTDLSNVAGRWVVEAAGASADAQNGCAMQMHEAIERWSNRLQLGDASPKGGSEAAAHADKALAHLSNALEDLESSPDQRPVPLIREAMWHLRQMQAQAGDAEVQP